MISKVTSTLLLAFIFSFSNISKTKAQFDLGDKLFTGGIGLNSKYTGSLPINIAFEGAVSKTISIGGLVNYLQNNYFSTANYKVVYLGARGSLHINDMIEVYDEKLDLFVRASAGARLIKWDDDFLAKTLTGIYKNGAFVGLYAGARYYFTDSIGGMAELGFGEAGNANIGITLKF